MIEVQIQHLQSDIAVLKHFIELRTAGSPREIPSLLEHLVRDVFTAVKGDRFRNLNNRLKVNFPAIDLGGIKSRTAVQVTINANKAKIEKTIRAFDAYKLKKDYDSLYVFGVKTSKHVKVDSSWCFLWDFDDVVDALRDTNDPFAVQGVVDAFRAHVDYTRLNPRDDVSCLRIILEWIDRNAVKHSMFCEGPYESMVKGFAEITEIIGRGTVDGRDKCKPMGQFADPTIRAFLGETKDSVSEILAIVNSASRNGNVELRMEQMHAIDSIKRRIIESSNRISVQFHCGVVMRGHGLG